MTITTGRFVILRHELPPESERNDHFDWMFESPKGSLATWATDQLPVPGQLVPAIQLPDHRMAYLDYEGPISKDRGHVTRLVAGNFETKNDLLEIGECIQFQISEIQLGPLENGCVELTRKQSANDQWEIQYQPSR